MSDTKEGGVLDSIIKGIGEAVTDVRHKVVEEGMWGRQVTPDAQPEVSPYAAEGMPATFGELRASKDMPDKGQAQERDKGPEKEPGE
jgi:hypothetical protein